MATTCKFSSSVLFLATFLTLLGPTLAYTTSDVDGKLNCISPNDPHICQIRYNAYYDQDQGNWPLFNPADYPYLGQMYAGAKYDVWIDVFDGFCNHIGMAVGYDNSHISVTSELPWTVELQAPINYMKPEELTGFYGGHGIWPSTNIVKYPDPTPQQAWGHMASALFGFAC